jgi:hypothetical protein
LRLLFNVKGGFLHLVNIWWDAMSLCGDGGSSAN